MGQMKIFSDLQSVVNDLITDVAALGMFRGEPLLWTQREMARVLRVQKELSSIIHELVNSGVVKVAPGEAAPVP